MSENISHSVNSTNLADILERVLDKGVVIAGDIKIQIADIDLLTIKIRLLVASVDKAMEMGINWWQDDVFLSSKAQETELKLQNDKLMERLEKLEASIK
jgi:Gas vesicle protein